MSQCGWNVILKIATAGLPVVGTLLGVVLGASIAKRNQRRQWIADCRKEEYRELVSVLTKAMTTYVFFYAPTSVKSAHGTMADAEAAMAETVSDRLFITEKVEQLRVLERWHQAADEIATSRDVPAFEVSIRKLLVDIRLAANADIPG